MAIYFNWWLTSRLPIPLPLPLDERFTEVEQTTTHDGLTLLFSIQGRSGVLSSLYVESSQWLDVDLVVSWDNLQPQIDAPLSMLFGMGGSREFGVSPTSNPFQYPMPFHHAVSIWVRGSTHILLRVGESPFQSRVPSGCLHGDYFALQTQPDAYFHIHQREHTPFEEHPLLLWRLHQNFGTPGRLVKITVQFSSNQKQVVENDFIVTLDGRVAMWTTGTEDLFEGGHGYVALNSFIGPRFGWNLSGDLGGDDNGAWRNYRQYRDFVADGITFTDSFEVDWEYRTPDPVAFESVLLYYSS